MSTRRRGVRSIVIRVAVFLLLGAVVNVAVAWGCVFIPQKLRELDSGTRQLESKVLWEVFVETSPGTQRFFSGEVEVTVWPRAPGKISLPPMPQSPPWTKLPPWMPVEPARLDAAGWPTLSLYARLVVDQSAQAYRSEPRLGGVCISRDTREDYPFLSDCWTLPLMPIWPGFAINTFFYAGILWLLFAASGRVRRWRRIRRGLCAKCAYSVGTSDVCTECGTTIRRVH